MTSVVNYIKNNKITFLSLFVFFLLALFLRTYRLADFMLWDDSARDIMVGERLAISDKLWLIAPFSAGSKALLLNSPVYYYVIAFFWLIARDPVGVTFIFSLLGSVTVFTNFLIGKELKNDQTGLIAAFLTATANVLVAQTSSILQPYLLPFFISLFILFLIKAYKNFSYTYLTVAIILFWFFYHIHYSILVVTPVFLGWIVITLYRIYKKRPSVVKTSYISLTFLSLFSSWYALTSRGSQSNIFKFIEAQLLGGETQSSLLLKTSDVLMIFFRYFKQLLDHTNDLFIVLAMCFTFGGLMYKLLWSIQKKQSFFIELSCLLFVLSIGFIGLFSGVVMDSYFVIFNTLIPVIIAFLVISLLSRRTIVAFSVVGLFAFYMNMGNFKFQYSTPSYSYSGAQSTAQLVIQDIESHPDLSLDTIFLGSNLPFNPYNWDAPRYWYFLEKHFDTKNLVLTASFNNLKSTTIRPQFFYLVCDLASDELFGELGCIGDYLAKYPDHLENCYQTIINPDNTEVVYKIAIKEGISEHFYWPLIYADYMRSDIDLN